MSTHDLRKHELLAQSDYKIRILFMGTGPFAKPILESLIAARDMQVIGVVTKPDAKVGRGKKNERNIHQNPIKELAISHEIDLYQPDRLDEAAITDLSKASPTILIVASYGKILPKVLLGLGEKGAINIHASLLPKFRGASPVQNALLLGESETGVSIMQMDEGLDTGPVFTQATLPITSETKTPELTDQLAILGAQTLLETLPDILAGKITAKPQNTSKATLCQIIDRDDGKISWLASTSTELLNKYRALTPWPGLFTYWQKEDSEPLRIKINAIAPYTGTTELSTIVPGSTFQDEKNLCVRTADSAIIITNLQRSGKSAQDAATFINGNPEFANAKLI